MAAQSGLLSNLRLTLAKRIAGNTAIVKPRPQTITRYGSGTSPNLRKYWTDKAPEIAPSAEGLALLADTMSWVSLCIELWSTTLSRLSWNIYPTVGNAPDKNTPVEDTAFHALIEQLQRQYDQDLFYVWAQQLWIHGEVYLEKIRNNNLPAGMRVLNAAGMDMQVTGGVLRRYQYATPGGTFSFRPDEIVMFRNPSALDDFRGVSPLLGAIDSINGLRASKQYLRAFWKNDATPGILITWKGDQPLDDRTIERVKAEWNEAFKGASLAHSAGFLSGPFEVNTFENRPPEHQTELASTERMEICSKLHIPPALVGAADVSDGLSAASTFREMKTAWQENEVVPLAERVARFIRTEILPWLGMTGYWFEFDTDEILALASQTRDRSDMVLSQYAAGAITFNQVQEALNYEPLPGGDFYLFKPGTIVVQAAQMADVQAQLMPPVAEPLPPAPLPPPPPMPALAPAVNAAPVAGKSAALMLTCANHPDLIALGQQTRGYIGDVPCEWNDPEDYHVTLVSFPAITDEQVTAIVAALDGLDVPELALRLGSLGVFESVGQYPIHFRVRRNEDLLALQSDCHDIAADAGAGVSGFSNPVAYKPHITMGYASSKPRPFVFNPKVTVEPDELVFVVDGQTIWLKACKPRKDEPTKAADLRDNPHIISYHDSPLDELAAWQRKVAGKNAGKPFKNYLVPDSVADAIRAALSEAQGDKDAIKAVFDRAREVLSYKAIQATRLDFEMDFEDLLAGARSESIDRRTFAVRLRVLLNQYGRRAYADGLRDGGLEDAELDEEDLATIGMMLGEQSGYVTEFGAVLYKGDGVTDAQADNKPAMWFNKSIMPFYQAGMVAADQNGLYEWVLGNTEEHCTSCITLNGQRHRMKQYATRSLIPPTEHTECGGWQCDCKLVKVNGKARGNWI